MFLSRPTARPLLPPSLPPGLIGSLGSQAAHTSNKFQLQKLIRGPMALALTAPSVSSKSHGLGVGERLLKVTLNTNTKHTWALTQTPLSPLFRECTPTAPHHRSGTFSIILRFLDRFFILFLGSLSLSISQRQCVLARTLATGQIPLRYF